MNNKLKMIAAGLGALGLCMVPQAKANLTLSGQISFVSFGYSATSSQITAVPFATAGGGTSSYIPLDGFAATFNVPISLGATSTTRLLWTVDNGVDTYEFFNTGNGAASVSTSPGPPPTVTTALSGTGYAEEFGDIGGAEIAGPSTGTWGITLNQSAGIDFLFTGTSTTGAPDGGTSLVMLGGAFCALGALRRKLGSK